MIKWPNVCNYRKKKKTDIYQLEYSISGSMSVCKFCPRGYCYWFRKHNSNIFFFKINSVNFIKTQKPFPIRKKILFIDIKFIRNQIAIINIIWNNTRLQPYYRIFGFFIRRANLEVLEVHARHCKFRNGNIRLSIILIS